jgi:hypothetical protein
MKLSARLLVPMFWVVSGVLLLLCLATTRALLDGRREIAASDAAFDANDLHASIQHARRAASAYVPGAPHVEHGYARLTAIAHGAEAGGKPDIAALAWQAQRAAVLESASFHQPFPERLDEANRNLARLAAMKTAAASDAAESARKLLEQARTRSEQRGPWGGVLALGLFLAATGVALVAGRAVLADGRINWVRGRLGLALFVAGAACWALAAYRA